MSKKFYRFYCEICNWKIVTDGTDPQLHEIKSAPIPGGPPKFDPVEKKMVIPKSKKPKRKFRCPGCGRVVIPREVENPQEKVERYQEQIIADKQRKEWEMLDAQAKERYEKIKQEYEKEQDQLDGC